MIEVIELLKNITELGLIYALVVLGVYVSSRIIAFDDLSVEGSFAVGGALTAQLLLWDVHFLVALPLALMAGCAVGFATGVLNTKLGMNNLISGIVITTALFSINLKLVGPNAVLGAQSTLFDVLSPVVGCEMQALATLIPLVLMIFLLVHWLLKTEVGLMLKTVGCNPQMVINVGKSVNQYKIAGLMIANALSALAGSLFVQHMKFFSITGSIGIIIIALAGMIIGKVILRSSLFGLIIGSLLYQVIITATIELQFDPAWNKLITAGLIIVLIGLRRHKGEGLSWR